MIHAENETEAIEIIEELNSQSRGQQVADRALRIIKQMGGSFGH